MQVKSAVLFCIKSLVFTAIFWGSWLLIVRPITNHPQSNTSSSQDAQAKIQTEAYYNQLARGNHLLDISEAQQQRMDKHLATEEENAMRFSAVLSVWEKQTGLRK